LVAGAAVVSAILFYRKHAQNILNENGFIAVGAAEVETGKHYTREHKDVISAEKHHLAKDAAFWALAISGGGIRSASFGLGVMQALVAESLLKKIDYLSTVSGGGYIGSALTWFLKKGHPDGTPAGTESENFPLGQIGAAGRLKGRGRNMVLDFIWLHGNYLAPGNGLGTLSLFGIMLRSMLLSLAVYLGVFTTGMWLLQKGGLFEPFSVDQFLGVSWTGGLRVSAFIWAAILTLGLLLVVSLFFSLRTVRFGAGRISRYRQLIKGQRFLGSGWQIILLTLLAGSVPHACNLLGNVWQQITAAGVSGVLGALSGFSQYHKAQDPAARGGRMSTLRIVIGAALLVYGLFVGAYVAALHVATVTGLLIVAGLTAILAFVVNLNYAGFHRMYRDRLMETFMPNPECVRQNRWGPATEADSELIENVCQGTHARPYHLVNTNVVLVDSPTSKFRGRGGDSFLISPLYCGSDATGWRATPHYMKTADFIKVCPSRGMTLATAMAISGAAVNPDAGVAGKGAMRNKIVSMLMGLLNLRLGYWAPNPRPHLRAWLPPNYIVPGLTSDILGSGLREDKPGVQLTDGGHFENLGLYELIRRKVRLIIASDAGADPGFQFGDLANAVERVRVDFGAKIRFKSNTSLDDILPGSAADSHLEQKYQLAKRGFAIADITYHDDTTGTLLYLKSTLTPELPADLYGYKSANPSYPDQSTGDQFFDEDQFEAYRELGYQLTKNMLAADVVKQALDDIPQNAKTKVEAV